MKWNENQLKAIENEGSSLLISAGAGSGKTGVLTKRIARLVHEGCELKNILVVTFTNAAAAEMKKRIQRNLIDLLSEEKDKAKIAFIRSQLEDFHLANISTLHSFCINLLRRHFNIAGIDPAFKICNEYQAAILKSQALDGAIDEIFDCEHKGFLRLKSYLKSEKMLCEYVSKIYDFMRSQCSPFGWIDKAISEYCLNEEEFYNSKYIKEIVASYIAKLSEAVRLLQNARELVPLDEGFIAVKAHLDNEISILRGFCFKADLNSAQQAASYKFKTLRFPSAKKMQELSPIDSDKIKKQRDKAKKLVVSPDMGYMLNFQIQKIAFNEAREMLEGLKALLELLDENYFKSKDALLDFNDLEQFTLKVLNDNKIAEEYKQKFEYIFIDEYQDTNEVQEEIIGKIVRDNNLFCVGDVKQSIYRFRAAEPMLFINREKKYQHGEGKVIYLNQNYRSAPNILLGINDIFSQIMHLGGDLSYSQNDYLDPGKKENQGASIKIKAILKEEKLLNDDELDDESQEGFEDIEYEAMLAARLIRERLAKPIGDEGKIVEYSDFAILMRNVGGYAECYAKVLAMEGIPAYVELSGGFFDALEIKVILNLLRLIDNKRNDIALLSIIRAGLFGFSDEDIINIRMMQKKGSFYSAFLKCAQSEGETANRCKEFLSFLNWSCQKEQIMPVSQLIELILEYTNYELICASMPFGAQRAANLESFLENARRYEAISINGLWGFINHMDDITKSGKDMGEARTVGEGSNCVTIMSIHKSKGLEFPIVILACSNRAYNLKDSIGSILINKDLGLGIKSFDEDMRLVKETAIHKAISISNRQKSIAEELRVLYVALTRAKDELIITAVIDNIEKCANRAINKQAKSNFEFMLSALIDCPCGQTFLDNINMYSGMAKRECTARFEIEGCIFSSLGKLYGQKEVSGLIAEIERLSENAEIIKKPIRFELPEGIQSKVTASSLGNAYVRLEREPKFMQGMKITPQQRGTAFHSLLENIDLRRTNYSEILEQINILIEDEILTAHEAKLIDAKRINAFFESEIGKRIKAAKIVKREEPFTMLKSASSLGISQSEDIILVQGIIDLCFMEEDGWVLIDYKTDHVGKGADGIEIAKAHFEQINIYRQALESKGLIVKECFIFLLSNNQAVKI